MHVGKRQFSYFFFINIYASPLQSSTAPRPQEHCGAGWFLLCYSWRFRRLIASCHLLHFLTKPTDPYGILIAFAVHSCFNEAEVIYLSVTLHLPRTTIHNIAISKCFAHVFFLLLFKTASDETAPPHFRHLFRHNGTTKCVSLRDDNPKWTKAPGSGKMLL